MWWRYQELTSAVIVSSLTPCPAPSGYDKHHLDFSKVQRKGLTTNDRKDEDSRCAKDKLFFWKFTSSHLCRGGKRKPENPGGPAANNIGPLSVIKVENLDPYHTRQIWICFFSLLMHNLHMWQMFLETSSSFSRVTRQIKSRFQPQERKQNMKTISQHIPSKEKDSQPILETPIYLLIWNKNLVSFH